MCQMHGGENACFRTKKPCFEEDSLFLTCHSCRKFWIYENFRSESSSYDEASNMAKSLFEGTVTAHVKKEAQAQVLQKLFISYAEKFRYNQVREALQEKMYKNVPKLDRGYQNIKTEYEEKEETVRKILRESEDEYGATKESVKSLREECRLLKQKRKTTVEIPDKRSRMIGAAWKNNILDCFEGVMKYWNFHGKHNHRDNLLKQYLGSLRPPPGAQYNYLDFCVDWVHLLRTGLGFESGVATIMSTIFDLWNNYKIVDRNGNEVIVRDASGNVTVLDCISRSSQTTKFWDRMLGVLQILAGFEHPLWRHSEDNTECDKFTWQ